MKLISRLTALALSTLLCLVASIAVAAEPIKGAVHITPATRKAA